MKKVEKKRKLYEPGHCTFLHMMPDKITRADSDSGEEAFLQLKYFNAQNMKKVEKKRKLYEPGHCTFLHMMPDKITRADSDSEECSIR